MSTSMVSTVLEIEREAEAILNKAERDAQNAIDDAKHQRKVAAEAYADDIKRKVSSLESAAATERAKKIQELTTSGEASLSAVRNISDAAFDSGVASVMKALSGQ